MPYPADSATYLDPRNAPIYNDVVGNEESRKLDQVNLFIDHSFGGTKFRSSTSWRQFDTVNREDEDGTNLIGSYFDTANIESNESFYQEFKFSGATERLDWVGGVSYYNEKADQVSDTHTFTDAIDTLGTNLGYWDALGLPFPLYGGTSSITEPTFGVSMLGLPWREAMYNHGDFEAIAAFGDVIWHVNDKTNLTLGLRYTQDTKEFTWTMARMRRRNSTRSSRRWSRRASSRRSRIPARGLSLLGHRVHGGHAGRRRDARRTPGAT